MWYIKLHENVPENKCKIKWLEKLEKHSYKISGKFGVDIKTKAYVSGDVITPPTNILCGGGQPGGEEGPGAVGLRERVPRKLLSALGVPLHTSVQVSSRTNSAIHSFSCLPCEGNTCLSEL